MKIIRHVPLGPALMAAGAVIDKSNGPDLINEAFIDWYNEPRINGRNVLHYPGLPADTVSDLLPTVPETPAGLAWKESAQACLTLTLADVNRTFDRITFDTEEEQAAAAAIDEFAETLRDASPMLDTVAGVVEDQCPMLSEFDIDDVHEARKRITDAGIVVGSDGYCDKHDDNCYGDHRTVAKWEHIEAIVPGARETLTGLLATFDAFLPEMVPGDGKSRRDRNDS
jgi:hypothetical protein